MKVQILSTGKNVRSFLPDYFKSLESISVPINLVYFDDCSNDQSLEYFQKNCNWPFLTRKSDHPIGKAAHIHQYLDSSECSPDDIIVMLDADDQISDPTYLTRLITYFQQGWHVIWSNYKTLSGLKGHCRSISPFASHRHQGWRSSHLFSFRAELGKGIPSAMMIDGETGKYVKAACDVAIALPILDRTIRRLHLSDEIPYLYRDNNPASHHNCVDRPEPGKLSSPTQIRIANQLYAKPPLNQIYDLRDPFIKMNAEVMIDQHLKAL